MLHIVLNHCNNVDAAFKTNLKLFGSKVKVEGWRHRSDHVCQFAKEGEDGKLVLSLQKRFKFISYLNYLIEFTYRKPIGIILCTFHSLYVVPHIVILDSSRKLSNTSSQILLLLNLFFL